MLAERILSRDTLLLLVGSVGPETAAILQTIECLGIQSRVVLVDSLADTELAWLYRNTLLLLCPSTIEGFGLPVAEAMQYGAQVVCSDIPVFREIASDSCTLFSLSGPDPVQSLVRACESALKKTSGLMWNSSLFSAEAVAAQWVALYSGLLQGHLARAA